jgi:hypothetical protein
VLVGVADGVAEAGVLLTGLVLAGAVVAGAVFAAGELLAPLGVVLAVAVPVALAAGVGDVAGDGLAGALPTVPPPRVVPWPGLP